MIETSNTIFRLHYGSTSGSLRSKGRCLDDLVNGRNLAMRRFFSRLSCLAIGALLVLVLTGCEETMRGISNFDAIAAENAAKESYPTPELRVLSEEAAKELNVGGGELAFALAIDVNGNITAFRPESAVVKEVKFPREIVALRGITPISIVFFQDTENTHICAGGTSGGGMFAFCPRH